ncbi:putative RNA-binding Zn ribbon-like protein [Motilibacter rhizosphaerae]|uniref:Putative RNA-binding Zn ribbon-like protein n=1 Tax=Motilibacter rhizosphaerae TaxID=598652 RepID=A0A4V2F528_9ACTN|nr:CGNR zinc finger domain-containing protein [Motilibacter rhizosphaerae]RZS91369.1 putative RNA-binding Zn ribbon-like protein [Motilibacter rhizosphaerae]
MDDGTLLLQDFLNTHEHQVADERVGTPAALAEWFVQHGLLPAGVRLTAADVVLAHDLREGLRELVQAHAGHDVDEAGLARLETALASVPLRLVPEHDGRLRLRATGARPVDLALARLLAAVAAAQEDGSWERLKVCARDSCRWAFLDTSRNRSGRWCSMAGCGNVVKTRRAYARRTGRAAP